MTTIRSLFSESRKIDRPIEKVIDYNAADDARLEAEIGEYEVTANIERAFERFLEKYGAGVRAGDSAEVGVWVSGFYGSGKSSFTKYLGLALDSSRMVKGRPFVDLLAERIDSPSVKAALKTLATQEPTAVVMLDLGSNMLASAALESVTNVLWWQTLAWAGYSHRDQKIAQLEFELERQDKYEAFKQRYAERFGDAWEDVHNNTMTATSRADQILPEVLPKEYPEPRMFLSQRHAPIDDVRTRAQDIIELVRRKSGRTNVLFVIDEVGQYVAPSREVILNLQGLAQSLRDLGKGKVWMVATGQQTLTETQSAAALNTLALLTLKDRFPVEIDLQAQDIREITQKRLLRKSAEGEATLRRLYREAGAQLATHTRLEGSELYKGDTSEDTFVLLYPFLPQHFEILFSMIRTLARSTGGIGLRSSIRVVQDVLVDASRALSATETALADLPVGMLARVDQFYDVLRADIGKSLPHVQEGMDNVLRIFGEDATTVRTAKAIAALQVIEGFPRTAENIAALLYPQVGAASQLAAVQQALERLVGDPTCAIVNDPQQGGYQFLSGGIRVLRDERDQHQPNGAEIARLRSTAVKAVLEPVPNALLEGARRINAGIFYQSARIESAPDLHFQLEPCAAADWERERAAWLGKTSTPELRGRIVWLFREPAELEERLTEWARSKWITDKYPSPNSDAEIEKYVRSELGRMGRAEQDVAKLLAQALGEGVFIYAGRDIPVARRGTEPVAAASKELEDAGRRLYPKLTLAAVRPGTDLASKFLQVERLDRMTSALDPLGLVQTRNGEPQVDTEHAALAEARRIFEGMFRDGGNAPVAGSRVLEVFEAPPYGWAQDATRYLFAALLTAGQIEARHEGEVYRTPGPKVAESFRSNQSFKQVGLSLRDSTISLAALRRAKGQMEDLFAENVFPSEQNIAESARRHVPALINEIRGLPERLRLLKLPGVERANDLLTTCAELLRGDASEAAGRFGDVEGRLADDIRWAKETTQALNAGGEQEVQDARAALDGLTALARRFTLPADAIDQGAAEELGELLTLEGFAKERATLREATRRLTTPLHDYYQQQRKVYQAQADEALATLQRLADWPHLPVEEQTRFAARLHPEELPESTPNVFAALEAVLGGSDRLAASAARVQREVEARARELLDAAVQQTQAEATEAAVERLRPRDLVKPASIANSGELDAWLRELDERLRGVLRQGRQIVIEDDV